MNDTFKLSVTGYKKNKKQMDSNKLKLAAGK